MKATTGRLGVTLTVALAVLGLGLAAGPRSAEAITVSEYEVTIEGEATYSRNEAVPSPFGPWTQREQAAFRWKTRFPSVSFLDKQVSVTAQAPETTVSEIDAELHTSIPTPEGPLTGACTGTTLSEPPGSGWLGGSLVPTPDPNVERLDVRTLSGVRFHLPSCTGSLGGGAQSFGIGDDNAIPFGPFDHAFDMPHEAVGMGKIIQLLDTTVSDDRCPGHTAETISCVLAWKATVTFVRTGHWSIGEGDIPTPPAPRPGAGPKPGGDKGPGSMWDGIEIPMPKRARLGARGERARLTLKCPVACAGTATAYPARLRGRARGAAVRPLARVRFKAAAGRRTTVVLRFSPRARRTVRRAGGVRVELRVTPAAGGRAARRSVTIRLPRQGRQG